MQIIKFIDMSIFPVTGSTTTASDVENIESTSTTPKSTELNPMTGAGSAPSQKMAQLSSMQENRLSPVQVDAPATGLYSEATEEPNPTTDDEVSSTSLQVTTDTEDVTTSDGVYKQPDTVVRVSSSAADMSTSSYTDRAVTGYKPYFIPASQVTTTATQTTTDVSVRVSTESLDSTTANLESTNLEPENTATEVSFMGKLSTEDDISLFTSAADENVVTSTTETLFQGTRDSDRDHKDGESLDNLETSDGAVGNETNSEGDESKQGGSNTFEKLQEEVVTRPGNGDGIRTEGSSLEGGYNQGDIAGNNSVEQNRSTEDRHQVDDGQSSEKLSIASSDGNRPYLNHEEPQDYGTPENVGLDDASSVVTGEAADASLSPLPGSYETHTSASSKY